MPTAGMVPYKCDHFPRDPQMNHSCSCSHFHPVPWKYSGACSAPGVSLLFPSLEIFYSFLSKSSPFLKFYFFHQACLLTPASSAVLLVWISGYSLILYCLILLPIIVSSIGFFLKLPSLLPSLHVIPKH